MFDRLIRGMSRTRTGIAFLTGAAAVLSGVGHVLARPAARMPAVPPSRDRFRIYRSESELGFVYWVLQGRGSFDCFALFDSWEQAMQEAERRIAVSRRIASPRREPARLAVAAR